jgi:hypothetical protein
MIDQSKRLVLLGGGGHALVIAEAAVEAEFELIGVYDDDPSCALVNRRRIKHLGRLADIPEWNGYDKEHQLQRFIIGLGQIPDRERRARHGPAQGNRHPPACDRFH